MVRPNRSYSVLNRALFPLEINQTTVFVLNVPLGLEELIRNLAFEYIPVICRSNPGEFFRRHGISMFDAETAGEAVFRRGAKSKFFSETPHCGLSVRFGALDSLRDTVVISAKDLSIGKFLAVFVQFKPLAAVFVNYDYNRDAYINHEAIGTALAKIQPVSLVIRKKVVKCPVCVRAPQTPRNAMPVEQIDHGGSG